MARMAPVPVDTHVHLYPGFDIARSLTAAAAHMALAPARGGLGVLCLAETERENAFATLPGEHGGWRITPSDEPEALVARREDGVRLLVVAGRQLVSSEGLEVLALGFTGALAPRMPLAALIGVVLENRALAVLPWGVGKWTGARGRVIDGLVAATEGRPDVFLADSGVRPSFLRRPARLASAEARGWRVLAGTDPLPLAGGDRQPGRFGILLDGLDPAAPSFRTLAERLRTCTRSPSTYGGLTPAATFLRQQVAMQLRKRRG